MLQWGFQLLCMGLIVVVVVVAVVVVVCFPYLCKCMCSVQVFGLLDQIPSSRQTHSRFFQVHNRMCSVQVVENLD